MVKPGRQKKAADVTSPSFPENLSHSQTTVSDTSSSAASVAENGTFFLEKNLRKILSQKKTSDIVDYLNVITLTLFKIITLLLLTNSL